MIRTLYNEMVLPSLPEGLCGIIYTQLSDIEDEINGLCTYDRQILKVTPERMLEITQLAKIQFAAVCRKSSVSKS